MNKFIFVILLLTTTFITSCKKKQIRTVEANLIEGRWKVDKFIVNGKDDAASYTTEYLVFDGDGFIQSEGTKLATGAWKLSKQKYLELYISLPQPLNQLTASWRVVKAEDYLLQLSYSDESVQKEMVLFR